MLPTGLMANSGLVVIGTPSHKVQKAQHTRNHRVPLHLVEISLSATDKYPESPRLKHRKEAQK